ncbi:MAG: hypothetical protein P8Z67_09230 [Gammaproteobacteria bacterium]
MRKLLLLTIGFIFITPAHADMLGVRLSGGMFKYSLSGTVRDNAVSTQVFDVKNDLGWKDETKGMGYLYIEHPIPLIPNFRIGTTSLQLGGTNTLTKESSSMARYSSRIPLERLQPPPSALPCRCCTAR